MTITTAELKSNLSKYLNMASFQNIRITENGNEIAILTSANRTKEAKIKALNSIVGIISEKNLDLKDDKIKRIIAKWKYWLIPMSF